MNDEANLMLIYVHLFTPDFNLPFFHLFPAKIVVHGLNLFEQIVTAKNLPITKMSAKFTKSKNATENQLSFVCEIMNLWTLGLRNWILWIGLNTCSLKQRNRISAADFHWTLD